MSRADPRPFHFKTPVSGNRKKFQEPGIGNDITGLYFFVSPAEREEKKNECQFSTTFPSTAEERRMSIIKSDPDSKNDILILYENLFDPIKAESYIGW